MLRLSDSRNFSRTLAAIGLIAGPLLFCLGNVVDPAWNDDNAAYLQEVADGKGAYLAAGILWTLGALLFIAGTLGLAHLLRGRRVTLGQFAAGLLTFGLIGMSAGLAFNGFEIAMADFGDRGTMVRFSNEMEEATALGIYWLTFFFGGIVLGSLLLAIALFRRRIVPIWSPILLIVAIVLGFLSEDSKWLSALSFLVLAAALVPLAMRMWAMSDDDWERWEPVLDRGSSTPPPAAPAPDEPRSASTV